MDKDRRRGDGRSGGAWARQLNDAQQVTLVDMERFGWELKFIRRPMFQSPLAVIFDPARINFAVLQEDGTLNEQPGFDIRK